MGKTLLLTNLFSFRYFWGACLLGISIKEVKWAKSLFETNFAQCKWDDRQTAEREIGKSPQKWLLQASCLMYLSLQANNQKHTQISEDIPSPSTSPTSSSAQHFRVQSSSSADILISEDPMRIGPLIASQWARGTTIFPQVWDLRD